MHIFNTARAGLSAALLLLTCAIMTPVDAMANIALDKVTVEFNINERPVENVNVINQSDKPSKVAVSIIEVKNSGQDGETEIPTDKVIVAPKTFEMAPGETRAVRIVLRDHPENLEGIYRIRFLPSEPSFTQEQKVEGKTVRVGVIMSMGVLVMVPPKNPKPDLKVTRTGNIISFENSGNITAHLQREDFCDGANCTALPGKRIYPGMKWQMTVPDALAAKSFSQTVQMNGAFSKLSYALQ